MDPFSVLSWLGESSIGTRGIPWSSLLCSIAALVFFLLQLSKLDSSARELTAALKAAMKGISELQLTDKQTVRNAFHTNSFFGEEWIEFCDTLIWTKTATGEFVRNTKQAEAFFTNEILLEKNNFNLSWYESFPGVLTAIGLLGTFISIYLALSMLQVSDSHGVQNITAFVNNLGGKFFSSIVGTGLALAFLLFERKAAADLNSVCIRFRSAINSKFEVSIPESLTDISKRLPDVIKTAVREAVEGSLNELIKSSTRQLALSEQQVNASKSLLIAIDSQAQKRDAAIQSMVASVVATFKEELCKATESEFDKLSKVLERTVKVVEGFNDRMQASISQTELLTKSTTQHVHEMARLQKEQNDLIIRQLGEEQELLMQLLQKRMEEISDSQHEKLELWNVTVEKACSGLLAAQDKGTEAFNLKLSEAIHKFLVQSEASSKKQIDSLREAHLYMTKNMELWVGTANEDLRNLVSTVTREISTVERCAESFDLVARALGTLPGEYSKLQQQVETAKFDTLSLIDNIVELEDKTDTSRNDLAKLTIGVNAGADKLNQCSLSFEKAASAMQALSLELIAKADLHDERALDLRTSVEACRRKIEDASALLEKLAEHTDAERQTSLADRSATFKNGGGAELVTQLSDVANLEKALLVVGSDAELIHENE